MLLAASVLRIHGPAGANVRPSVKCRENTCCCGREVATVWLCQIGRDLHSKYRNCAEIPRRLSQSYMYTGIDENTGHAAWRNLLGLLEMGTAVMSCTGGGASQQYTKSDLSFVACHPFSTFKACLLSGRRETAHCSKNKVYAYNL